MNKSVIIKRITACALPFAVIPLMYFSAVFVIRNITLPPCIYYTTAHIYCPGCGFTRAVEALMRGDVLLSLRQNPLLIIGMVLLAVYYIGFLVRAFGGSLKIKFLHSTGILWASLIFLSVFTVLRNVIPAFAPV